MTNERDPGAKRQLPPEVGVREHWIVEVYRRRIERWQPEQATPRNEEGIFE